MGLKHLTQMGNGTFLLMKAKQHSVKDDVTYWSLCEVFQVLIFSTRLILHPPQKTSEIYFKTNKGGL